MPPSAASSPPGKPAGTITGGAASTKRLFGARGCGFVAAGVDALLLAGMRL